MTLGELLQQAGVAAALPDGAAELEVSSVELDSRRCSPGSVFVCLQGATTTGEAFVDDALARGAVCVVASSAVTAPIVVRVEASSMRRTLAALSATVVGTPAKSLTLAGVTGTNGKTTVTWLLDSVLNAVGYSAASIGTLTGARTTPPAPELHRALRAVADHASASGRPGAASLEVSSHALDQGRVDGLTFDVAVFTNLSHEHLDYHGTMERYFAAKASLFEPTRASAAVVCVDDEWGRRLAARTSIPTVEVATSEAVVDDARLGATTFRWRDRRHTTRLTGSVNVTNAMLTLAACDALGVDTTAAADALEVAPPVPGRYDLVAGGPPSVVVDYAHSPDALARVLTDLRTFVDGGRLVVVFGCGGDRDREKRPVMGRVATTLADEVVVTSDNPRSEDPAVIADEVLAGATGPAAVRVVLDRRDAVAETVAAAGPHDVVLVAGKGHETTQEVNGHFDDLDDRVIAARALAERGPTC